MRRLRVAVVGAGFIATRKHLPALIAARDVVRAVALVDADLRAARLAARRFGVRAVYSDLKDLLERGDVDLIHICTPPGTHADLAIQAIQAGCHVLIEKPMAISSEECDRIIAVATDAGVRVCVAHTDLFYPPVMRARRLVEQGSIGQFMGMRILLSTPTDYMTSQPDHWAHRLPGGVISESGPHAVYLSLAFIPQIQRVRVLASRLLSYDWSRFDDYRIDLIGDHAVSSVTSLYTTNQWAADVDIWGTEGLLHLDLESMSLLSRRRPVLGRSAMAISGLRKGMAAWMGTVRTAAAVLSGQYQDTHQALIRRFVSSILTGTASPVSPEEGREAVRVMELITSALREQAGTSAPAGVGRGHPGHQRLPR